MILLIDNYDSFVFNLARYVVELGFECVVFRNDQIDIATVRRLAPSHIIISPGPCTPFEAGISIDVIKELMQEIPILGVCLGHQALAVACGGQVGHAKFPMHGKAAKVFHDGHGLFKGLPNPLNVGRYHSLIVEKTSLPEQLLITATSAEGEIMAMQHQHYPLYGVQFHPESVLTEHGHEILHRFLQ